jgi:co-chaperonin GroES (HSP10)
MRIIPKKGKVLIKVEREEDKGMVVTPDIHKKRTKWAEVISLGDLKPNEQEIAKEGERVYVSTQGIKYIKHDGWKDYAIVDRDKILLK